MKNYHNYIVHTGVKRKSGRYDWGSGQNPYQHEPWFQGWGDLLKEYNGKRKDIAEAFNMTTKELNARYGYAKDFEKAAQIAHAIELRNNRQMSVAAIADKMGVSQSTVKSWLAPDAEKKAKQRQELADALAKQVDKKKYIDVGSGVEVSLGIKRNQLDETLTILKDKGYQVLKYDQPQATNPQHKTHMLVLMTPKEGMSEKEAKSASYKELMENKDKIELPYEIRVNSEGETVTVKPPVSISSKRIMVRYADDKDSGLNKDGLIEIRRGVDDLYLGDSRYAQVRIAVDDTHYLKGMCVYNDNMPKGVDIIFNTNKKRGVPLKSDDPSAKQVLKPMERDVDGNIDHENPFGAQIKPFPTGQYEYKGKDGKMHLGAINKVNDEKDWNDWTSNKTLASQVLIKQDVDLAKRQLNLAYAQKADELADIQKITNPIVKAQRLNEFAESCDTAAVHLKAAALPGQAVKVMLPVPSLKENECYCPDYKDGDKVALIRYPHGSKAEIPILTVNNSNKDGKKIISGAAHDAIGIPPKAAERLSGADFDGDTAVVIPNKHGWIKNAPAMDFSKFDPHTQFANPPGTPKPNQQHMQHQMGVVTNLITDMSLIGAKDEEIERAIKHSMVVIDAYKHNLNWKASYEEFRIGELHEKYQGKKGGGAVTIVSKASGEAQAKDYDRVTVNPLTGEKERHLTEKKRVYFVNPDTGKKYYRDLFPNQAGYDPNAKDVTVKSTKMAETNDAMTLVSKSKYPMELVYANYANSMKAMANNARKEALANDKLEYNKEAAKEYAEQVTSLKSKIAACQTQAPLERRAQSITDVIVASKIRQYPDRYDRKTPDGKKNLKKLRSQIIAQQRSKLKGNTHMDITYKEWEAIQAGAVNKTTLLNVIRYAKKDRITELSTPKDSGLPALSMSNIAHARAMLNSRFTQKEVADYFGVSVSTLKKYL